MPLSLPLPPTTHRHRDTYLQLHLALLQLLLCVGARCLLHLLLAVELSLLKLIDLNLVEGGGGRVGVVKECVCWRGGACGSVVVVMLVGWCENPPAPP